MASADAALWSELNAMLADEPNCTLECSDATVPAHADILALASPVLRGALELSKSVKVCCLPAPGCIR